jgi:hypothetical protein
LVVGWQLIPMLQAPHVPLWHTMSVPQDVPFALLPPSAQTGVPVPHAIVPFLHGLGFCVHAIPIVQSPHTPSLHTRFVPHEVPLPLLVVSPHTGKPVVHEIDPFLQALLGWQDMLIVQAPHVPSLQTMFVPHDVPFGLSPVTLQTITPVAQEFAPVWHWFVGWQLVPEVQGEHVPLLQTMFAPQDVPFALLPPSAQVIVPVAHEVVPFLHGFVCVQAIPGMQPPHAPLLHT